METLIDVLKNNYDTTISQQKDWHFFSFLSDYVKFVKDVPEIRPIIADTQVAQDQKLKKLQETEKEAVIELVALKDALLKEIKKKKIACNGLPEALIKLKDYEDGKIDPSHYKSARLDNGIKGIIKVLPDSEKWAKKYDTHTEKYIERGALNFSYNNKKKTELWGVWDKLLVLHTVMSEGDEHFQALIL